MNKYSLEAFEKYSQEKLRFQDQGPQENYKRAYTVQEAEWQKENVLPKRAHIGEPCLLSLSLQADSYTDTQAAHASAFVRRLAAATNGGEGYIGVLVDIGGFTGSAADMLLRTYERVFTSTNLIVRLTDTEVLQGIRITNFGLLLNAATVLETRLALARGQLQKKWQAAPVLLCCGASKEKAELLKAGEAWHVYAADTPSQLGSRLALRRLTYPKELSAGGVIPLRFWWQNIGSSPEYIHTELAVFVKAGQKLIRIEIADNVSLWGIGDRSFNCIARLPKLPSGTYALYCAVLGAQGATVPLNIGLDCDEGTYMIGSVHIDELNRDYLEHIWEDFYPDGYYPLEDPKLPV